MGRSKIGAIAISICFFLTIGQPAFLDQVRYPMALVLSWPARVLFSWTNPPPPDPTVAENQSLRLREVWQRAQAGEPNGQGFRVFSTNAKRFSIFIAGGWNEGIRRGDVVHDNKALLGFVDLVTETASRVRLISYKASHVAGQVKLRPNEKLPRGASPDLLLSGRGEFGLVARQGCRIHRDFLGRPVQYLDDQGLWKLTIGKVAFSEELNQLVVLPDFKMDQLERVLIGDRSAGPQEAEGKDDVMARVMSFGRTSVAGKRWWLSKGSQAGILEGSWVSCGGALVGRIERVGFLSSFMRLLDPSRDLVTCKVVDLEDGVVGDVQWPEEKEILGHRFSKGRSKKKGLPAGLWLGHVGDSQVEIGPPAPQFGEMVTIHGALSPRLIFQLDLTR